MVELMALLYRFHIVKTPIEKLQLTRETFVEVKEVLVNLQRFYAAGRIIKIAAYLKGEEELNGKNWAKLHSELNRNFERIPDKKSKIVSRFRGIFNTSLGPGKFKNKNVENKLLVAMGVINDLVKLVDRLIVSLQPQQEQLAAA